MESKQINGLFNSAFLNMGKLFILKGLIGLTAIQVGSLVCIWLFFTVDWFQKFIKKSQREMEIYRLTSMLGTFIPAFFYDSKQKLTVL
jgi:hypothetical protein